MPGKTYIVNLSKLDNTQDIALSATKGTLKITGGSSVTLADSSVTNELQRISKLGRTVSLSHGGGTVTDEVDDADSDPTNELQKIYISKDTLILSDGGKVLLPRDLTYDGDLITEKRTSGNNKIRR